MPIIASGEASFPNGVKITPIRYQHPPPHEGIEENGWQTPGGHIHLDNPVGRQRYQERVWGPPDTVQTGQSHAQTYGQPPAQAYGRAAQPPATYGQPQPATSPYVTHPGQRSLTDVSQYKEISRPPTPSKGNFVTHKVNDGDRTEGTLFVPRLPPTDGSPGYVLYPEIYS
jgi:hypothetical protein